jgi:peptidoglycan/xylan/chitin deacetylase (PgdA/CDA1 family)
MVPALSMIAAAIPQVVKTAARSAAGQVYRASSRLATQLTGKVLILMYHRVIPRSEVEATFVQPGMYVTPETFERHLQFLSARFEIVPLSSVLARWREGRWESSARYCVLTFDDGWLDNYRYAYPLLHAYRAPATIFLPTDMIGTDACLWSDRLGSLLHRQQPVHNRRAVNDIDAMIERAKTLSDDARERMVDGLADQLGAQVPPDRRLVNWAEVREMSREGISFGSHTCTHANLTRLDDEALERELRRPIQVLEQHRVNHVRVLSYPNGDHTDAVVAAAQAAGYDAAVTTNPGPESARPADLFRLKRIGVHEDVSRSDSLLTFHIAQQSRNT